MSVEEFKKTEFRKGDVAEYRHRQYPIMGVNFYEELLLIQYTDNSTCWVRCENISFIRGNHE